MSEQQFRKAALDFLAAHGVATIDLQKGELRVALEAAFREIDRSNASEASLTAALSALRAEHQRTQREIEANLDVIAKRSGKAIRVRENGGPEDLLASLAVSVAALLDQHQRLTEENATLKAAGKRLLYDIGCESTAVSPEEHQRVVAERDEARTFTRNETILRKQKQDELDRAKQRIAELEKRHEENRPNGCIHQDKRACRACLEEDAIWDRRERDDLRAALAASEEKARGMREALIFVSGYSDHDGHVRGCGNGGENPEDCAPSCVLVARALSPSAGPAPKTAPPARWCALCHSPPEKQPGTIDGQPCPTCGDFAEPSAGPASEEPKR